VLCNILFFLDKKALKYTLKFKKVVELFLAWYSKLIPNMEFHWIAKSDSFSRVCKVDFNFSYPLQGTLTEEEV
jgi:hypothetical protein